MLNAPQYLCAGLIQASPVGDVDQRGVSIFPCRLMLAEYLLVVNVYSQRQLL